MREKKFWKKICIFFALAIFFYPVKQIPSAFSFDENSEVKESEEVEIIHEQEEGVDGIISEQEEELRNEAEELQDAYEEEPASESGYGDEEFSEESEEYVPESNYDENGLSEEYAIEPDYDESEPSEFPDDYAPEPGSDDENQPLQIEEMQQPKVEEGGS